MDNCFKPFVKLGDCFIVGEVAQAHDGSLGMAHAYIDLLAEVGADAVKFQTHLAEAESTPQEPWRVAFSWQDASRFDYWKRMEFTLEQWSGLRDHARQVGLAFVSSPFSVEAVELMERINLDSWKIASGEITNVPMLDRIRRSDRPTILSTGMSPIAEIEHALSFLDPDGSKTGLLQCTSRYPCPLEEIGLNLLPELRSRFARPVGLSDHSGKAHVPIAATALGLDLLEVHITFDRRMFGPDVPASLEPDDFRRMVQAIRDIECIRAHPVDKDAASQNFDDMRGTFMRGLIVIAAVKAGEPIRREVLRAKKPLRGLPASRFFDVLDKPAARDIPAGAFLEAGDVVL